MPRTRLSLKSAGSWQPSPSNTKVLVMAHSSSNRCQSLLERARRDDSREKIAPTCPIATSLTRVLKSSRLVICWPDCARSPSRIRICSGVQPSDFIAMGGSTNTVLHLLAAAHEGQVPFTMSDIDRLSRKVPVLCKVAPSVQDVHMEDVHHAGGIMAILGELDRAGLITTSTPTVHTATMSDALDRWDIVRTSS